MEVKKSEELVPGDIVILEAGDAVPADGRILESASMKIEEAALTGESVPVNKTADVLNAGAASEVPLGTGKHGLYGKHRCLWPRPRCYHRNGYENRDGKNRPCSDAVGG